MYNLIKHILTPSLLIMIALGGFFVSVDIVSQSKTQQYTLEASITLETHAANGPISGPAFSNSATPTTATTNTTTIQGVDAASKVAQPSEAESKWISEAIQAVNAILGILTVIVSPAIVFAGWLMSPDWTSGDLFGLREPMHKMWVIVSNIVYFIYAILLILIALATIFGKENFSYKAMLPKLAIGILMVPFTWWFVQWTISLATVVTASVINIPMDLIITDNSNKYINGNFIPKKHYITTVDNKTTSTTNSKDNCNKDAGGDSTNCTNIQDMLKQGGGTYSTLMIYAYQVFRIQDIKKIDTTRDKIESGFQLLNGIVIGAIMFLVFGLLVMALIFMLMMRAIKLWFYAIFSPIFTLHFVAGKELFGKSTEGFDLKEFIGLCFVPAVVGITLSFGLMIVSVIQAPKPNIAPACTSLDLGVNDIEQFDVKNSTKGCTLIRLFGNGDNKIIKGTIKEKDGKPWMYNIVHIGGITLYFKGKAAVSNEAEAAAAAGSITGALDSAGGIFGTLILDIIALIFIWMSFMAAKGVSKAVSAAVEPFEELGKSVGKLGASLPKYAPLPIPGGSMAGANKIAGMGSSVLEYQSNKKVEESGLGKYFKEKSGQTGNVASYAKTKDIASVGTTKDLQADIRKYKAEDNAEVIKAMTATKGAMDRHIQAMNGQEKANAEVLYKKYLDGNAEPHDLLALQALMGGMSWSEIDTQHKGKNTNGIKTKINARAGDNSSTAGAGGNTENKVNWNNGNMEIKINNTNITANSITSSKTPADIAGAIKKAPGSDNYQTQVTKEQFIETMTSGLGGTSEAAEKAKKIAEELKDDFFKSEPKAEKK